MTRDKSLDFVILSFFMQSIAFHYCCAEGRYAESNVMLYVIMLNVAMQKVVMLKVTLCCTLLC